MSFHPAHGALLSLCVIDTAALCLKLAVLRTALIYLVSPCDLGQQICGIRPAVLSPCNVSQTASCSSLSAQIQPDSSCTRLIAGMFCTRDCRMVDVRVRFEFEFKRSSALPVHCCNTLPTPVGGLFLMFSSRKRPPLWIHIKLERLFAFTCRYY